MTSRMSFSEVNAPETRISSFSSPVCSDPEGTTAFCACSAAIKAAAIDAEAGELLRRKFDENLLVLGPEEFDLGYVGNLQQTRANILDVIAQFAMGEAVCGEAVDQAIGVAEVIVEPGPNNSGRERMANVANVLAHLIPDIRHFGGLRRAFQIDENGGEPGLRVAAQKVEALGFLQLALDTFGDLLQCFVHRRAGPGGLDDHRSERERGVLAAPQPEIGSEAGDRDRNHREDDERPVFQRPIGEIGADHDCVPSSRTF